MKPSIAAKLAQLAERLDEVNTLLSSEDATRDMDGFRKLNRERTEIEPVVALFHAYQACESDIATAQEMADLTMDAFTLADQYRTPVMILADGMLGQMMEPVEFPDHLKSEPSNKDDWATSGMDKRKSNKRNLVRSLFLDPTELNNNNLCILWP